MPDCILPFPRGRTMSDNGVAGVTLDDNSWKEIEGQIFEVRDTIHGTGQPVLLRAVKLDAAVTVARKGLRFSTATDTDYGRRMAGLVNVAGMVGKPLDDAYTVGQVLAKDDIVYVIESGPWGGVTEASSVSLSAGDPVKWDAAGLIDGAIAETGEYAFGTIAEASTTASETVLVQVAAGIQAPLGT